MQVLGFLGRWGSLSLSVVSMACSVEVGADHTASNAGTTRAVIAVTRSAPASAPDAARADAFAGFLRTPAGADAKSALVLAGLRVDLPANGECRKGAVREGATSGLTAAELLDAGEVTVTAGGIVTTLAGKVPRPLSSAKLQNVGSESPSRSTYTRSPALPGAHTSARSCPGVMLSTLPKGSPASSTPESNAGAWPKPASASSELPPVAETVYAVAAGSGAAARSRVV
jgi:hypothetical protein